MAKRKNTEQTPATEQVVVPTPEIRPKAAFRGAGFVKFREEHEPRWCAKANATVHDNEDEIAETLAFEIREFGWWNSPLVLRYLGPRIPELQVRYASLNAGMVRMNLGNMIRAAIRREAKAK